MCPLRKGLCPMLVLARRVGEKVLLPGLDITLHVVAIKPGVVRLGIDAPPTVPIFREEVLARDQARPDPDHQVDSPMTV
jgi:carbon storage regulator CsrA